MENDDVYEEFYTVFRQKVEALTEIVEIPKEVKEKSESPSEHITGSMEKAMKQWGEYKKELTKTKERRQQLLAQEARELSQEEVVATEGDAVKKELETVEGEIVGIEEAIKKLIKRIHELVKMVKREEKLLKAENEIREAEAEAFMKLIEEGKKNLELYP